MTSSACPTCHGLGLLTFGDPSNNEGYITRCPCKTPVGTPRPSTMAAKIRFAALWLAIAATFMIMVYAVEVMTR